MNIIKSLQQRISERLQETKNPCKNYKTEEACEKATAKVAALVGEHHETDPANYVVFFHKELGAWVGAIDINGTVNRYNACGGYVGLAGEKGFYTF